MIPRYQLPEMAALFSDEAQQARMLEIELLATEAWAALGVVPAADAAECRERAPVVDAAFVAAVAERERVTDHDVAAFVDVVQAAIGGRAGAWIHYGLTSSDVVDTAWCWALRDAADLLLGGLGRPRDGAEAAGRSSTGDTAMVGPHARHPRRTDDVRGQAGPLGPPGRPRPRAPAGGP